MDPLNPKTDATASDNVPPPTSSGGAPPSNPPKLDHNSPFYCSVTFTGNNYNDWSKSLRLSLIARRKFGFIDGSVEKPITGPLVADWQCVQAMLVQWILNTINLSLRRGKVSRIMKKQDLCGWFYNVGSGTRKQQLKAALAECRQTAGMSIVDYFGKLQPLWDELATYDPLLLIEIMLWRFLLPRPTLEEQLQSHKAPSFDRDNAMAFSSSSRGTSRFERTKNTTVCTFCHHSGHDITSCFSKDGFPDWWGGRPRGSGRGLGSKAAVVSRNSAGRGRESEMAVSRGDGSTGVGLLGAGSTDGGALMGSVCGHASSTSGIGPANGQASLTSGTGPNGHAANGQASTFANAQWTKWQDFY